MEDGPTEQSKLLSLHDTQTDTPHHYKLVRSAHLFSLWIIFGCYCEITGPVIPELIAQTHSNYEVMSQGIAMRGAGHALGGVLGGLTVDRFFGHIDLVCTVWTVLYVIVSVAKSYVTSVPALFMTFYVQGALETILHTAGYRIIHKTWRAKASVPFHFVNVGFGIGSIIVPFLVRPYLDPRFSGSLAASKYNQTCNMTHYQLTNSSLVVDPNSTTDTKIRGNDYKDSLWSHTIDFIDSILTGSPSPHEKYPANFVTAYWILAPFGVMVGLGFIFNKLYTWLKKIAVHTGQQDVEVGQLSWQQKLKSTVALSTCSPRKPRLGIFIIIMVAFYTAACTPIARAFPKYIFSYARDGACMSVDESTELQSAYFGSVTGGRLSGFLLSGVLSNGVVMQIGVFGIVGSCLGLFFGNDNKTILWILTCSLGFFTGPIATTIYAWANRYVEMTSMAQIIPELGAAAGDVSMLLALGWSYDTYGPPSLWTYMLGFCAGLAVISWTLLILGWLHGDRFVITDDNESSGKL